MSGKGPRCPIEVGAVVDRLVEFGVREPLQGASRHPAAGGSTGQHSANISGRMARGDSQAGRPRRRSTRMQ